MEEKFFSAAFGRDVAKSVIISTAVTVGWMAGTFAVIYAAEKVDAYRNSRKSKIALTK